MPIYEYEPVDHDCLMCPNRVGVIQSIGDPPLKHCPDCGLPIRRVLSSVYINLRSSPSASEAAKRGFTTWKKAGKGTWEKVDGPGAEIILGEREAQQSEPRPPKKPIDLDKS